MKGATRGGRNDAHYLAVSTFSLCRPAGDPRDGMELSGWSSEGLLGHFEEGLGGSPGAFGESPGDLAS